MKTGFVRQNVLPILAALIWGTAFVAQSVGADLVPAFAFNAARSVVAFVFLLIVCLVLRTVRRSRGVPVSTTASRAQLILGGLCCGAALTVATYLQQKGLEAVSSGKAGFLTALYIILVPLLGLLLKKKAPKTVWIGVVLALAGLYCLCVTDSFTSITVYDLYLLLGALCFAIHILVIDHFTQKVDGVELSCAQFLVATILSTAGMLLTEQPTMAGLTASIWPILYVGVLSSGVAYTLQIEAQRGSDPTVVSLLLSLESVFSVLAGAVVLHDRMSGREYFGCVLMLAAVVLAQLPDRKKPKAASSQ